MRRFPFAGVSTVRRVSSRRAGSKGFTLAALRSRRCAVSVESPPDLGDKPHVILHPAGRDGAKFRAGWVLGRESLATGGDCPFPARSAERAAWLAARAYHQELGE
jgi:hypothetical protein